VKLYLVQHGEACSKDVDPDRPLTERGAADIERLAAFLGRAGVRVERVIHSGKLRAVQTAECLAKAIAPGVEPESSGIINPNDDPRAFDWQSGSWDRDTLVVGHLPFMSRLVSHLVIDNEDRTTTAWKPGSILCLVRENSAHWQIEWMLRPELFEQR
jgi:phosphohistidine phosphatase